MGVYLAVDAGGTRTECVLAEEERVLARVSGGTVKLAAVGAAEATVRLQRLVREAGAAAGVPLDRVKRTCAGVAGMGSAGVRGWAETVLGGLVGGVCVSWGMGSVEALLAKANSQPRPDFAVLAEAVERCAAQGDALARSVLERAGEELAAQVGVVVSKMRAAACAEGDVQRVACAGGVLNGLRAVRAAMPGALGRTQPAIRVEERVVEPILGRWRGRGGVRAVLLLLWC